MGQNYLLVDTDNVYVNQDLVLFAIRQLSDANLLDAKMHGPDKPDRISRRKLLRQIGAGSAVALPIIHSIVAPQAGAAATVECTTDSSNTQGTCPSDLQRCVDDTCIPCVEAEGSLSGSFCNNVDIRLCCPGLTCANRGEGLMCVVSEDLLI